LIIVFYAKEGFSVERRNNREIKREEKSIREHNNNKQKTVVYQSKDILKEG